MKDDWRLEPLVARVVAWHNRHPLARRITPQQVRSLGFVALPFAVSIAAEPAGPAAEAAAAAEASATPAPNEAEAPGSLRERALARSRQATAEPIAASAAPSTAVSAWQERGGGGATTAAFSEDFIAPLSPPHVARWAARFAREAAGAPAGGPLRQVAVDDTRVPFGHRVVMRHAMTAAIEAGGARTRLLLGPDPRSAVLGRRLWSRPRTAVAGGGVMAVCSLLAAVMTAWPGDGPALSPTPTMALVTRSAGAAAVPAASAAQSAYPGHAAQDATRRFEAPPDVEPRLGRIELPPPVPALDTLARAAAHQARADLVPSPSTTAEPTSTVGATPAAPSQTQVQTQVEVAAVPPQAFWALTTRLLRTRTESLQWRQAVDALLREQGHGKLQVEMLQEGDDWRVVGWPFTNRVDAERARATLLARGLKMEVVDF